MSYTARNITSNAGRESDARVGSLLSGIKIDGVTAVALTIFKQTFNVSDIGYICYRGTLTGSGNNTCIIKFVLDATQVGTANNGGGGAPFTGDIEGFVDITTYTGEKSMIITIEDTGGSGSIDELWIWTMEA